MQDAKYPAPSVDIFVMAVMADKTWHDDLYSFNAGKDAEQPAMPDRPADGDTELSAKEIATVFVTVGGHVRQTFADMTTRLAKHKEDQLRLEPRNWICMLLGLWLEKRKMEQNLYRQVGA